jgi:hypothetical protein
MKTIKTTFLALVLVISMATVSFSQSHSHKPPHGGTLRESGGYHIEMVSDASTVSFYVMDASNKVLDDKTLSGEVVFENANKTGSKAALKKVDSGALQAELPKKDIFATCTANLMVRGKAVSVDFKNKSASEKDIEHGHKH